MAKIILYSISDKYIAFLRKDIKLSNVFDNKENYRSHTRKYLGISVSKNGINYFIPFSSPKNSDYSILENGNKIIRKSIIPIIRMTTYDNISKNYELKGTLKLSNMIPVPKSELIAYDFSLETDINYKLIVKKEYEFIKKNIDLILNYSNIIYNQKTNEKIYFSKHQQKPKYLDVTVDFLYAEKMCSIFINNENKNMITQQSNEIDCELEI